MERWLRPPRSWTYCWISSGSATVGLCFSSCSCWGTRASPRKSAYVLKRLRNGPLTADDRVTVAGALRQLLSSGSSLDLRLQAALALGEFTEIAGVLSALGALALEPHESIDLRYAAFTSFERAGPTTECVNLLHQLSSDDMLGCAVRSVLVRWRLESF